MNSVTLFGRLVKDPELRYTTGAEPKSVATFTLAVNRPKKEADADFIRCVAFGRTADLIGTYVSKGHRLIVNGSIRTGSYEANDGTRRYTTDVWVNNIEFVEKANGESKPAPRSEQKQERLDPNAIPDGFEVIEDENIPF